MPHDFDEMYKTTPKPWIAVSNEQIAKESSSSEILTFNILKAMADSQGVESLNRSYKLLVRVIQIEKELSEYVNLGMFHDARNSLEELRKLLGDHPLVHYYSSVIESS